MLPIPFPGMILEAMVSIGQKHNLGGGVHATKGPTSIYWQDQSKTITKGQVGTSETSLADLL